MCERRRLLRDASVNARAAAAAAGASIHCALMPHDDTCHPPKYVALSRVARNKHGKSRIVIGLAVPKALAWTESVHIYTERERERLNNDGSENSDSASS